MGILNKKSSNQKEEVKTAQAYDCVMVIIYEGKVNCPDCSTEYKLCAEGSQPKSATCTKCNKQFNIDWE